MLHWIKVFYSNQAVLDQRTMKLRFVIPLLFILFLFISIPNFIGLYTQKTTYFLSKMDNFESDYVSMLEANGCGIDTTLICTDTSDHIWKGSSTTFHFFTETTDKERKNVVYFLKGGVVIYDKDGVFLTSGDYANFGKYDFAQIAKQVADAEITKTDLAALFMRNVSLSLLGMKLTLIYFAMAFQYLIYVLVLSFLFKFLGGRKEENKISFKQSFVMMVNLMLAPAMICAFIGVFNPTAGSLLIPFVFVGRMIVLYQGVIRKRLKLGTAESVS